MDKLTSCSWTLSQPVRSPPTSCSWTLSQPVRSPPPDVRSFLGAKLFYKRVCPSVTNSPTLSLTFSCFPFKIKVIELTLCKKKIIFLLKICSHLMRFYFVTHSLSKSWGLALFIYWLIPREYNGKSY